jgi:hypothetical protein
MRKTKAEKRETKKRNDRKMVVSNRSIFTLWGLLSKKRKQSPARAKKVK